MNVSIGYAISKAIVCIDLTANEYREIYAEDKFYRELLDCKKVIEDYWRDECLKKSE